MDCIVSNLSVVTKTDAEGIIKASWTKYNNAPQLYIVNIVCSMFDDALQFSYFNTCNNFKAPMLDVAGKVLSKVVPSYLCPYSHGGSKLQPGSAKVRNRYHRRKSTVQHRF